MIPFQTLQVCAHGGYRDDILQSIDFLIFYMISRHNKVYFLRFDLTYPLEMNYPRDNDLVCRFIEALNLHCKRRKLDPKYLWVREYSSYTGNHHYHFILLLNGNKIQNPYGILNKTTELWGRCLGVDGKGLVNFCDNGEYPMIRRNDPTYNDALQECLRRAMYLAKTYSKGLSPERVREWGMSRTKNMRKGSRLCFLKTG